MARVKVYVLVAVIFTQGERKSPCVRSVLSAFPIINYNILKSEKSESYKIFLIFFRIVPSSLYPSFIAIRKLLQPS